MKIAPTGSLFAMTIVQVVGGPTAQFEDHPPNVEPGAGAAVNVTVVLLG